VFIVWRRNNVRDSKIANLGRRGNVVVVVVVVGMRR
jgi:hypothetical protein